MNDSILTHPLPPSPPTPFSDWIKAKLTLLEISKKNSYWLDADNEFLDIVVIIIFIIIISIIIITNKFYYYFGFKICDKNPIRLSL